MHAMRRRCMFISLSDPTSICKLFDILVLPILAYGCQVWAIDPKVAENAEKLHRLFLKQLLGVRKSTTNLIVLADFGRFPLQFHCWQHILRYHNRALHLPNSRLVKLALVGSFYQADGSVFCVEPLSNNWGSGVCRFVENYPGQRAIFGELDVTAILDREKERYLSTYRLSTEHSSLQSYRELNPDDQYAAYLSNISCYPNGRTVSRYRCQWSGLRVDTGRFEKLRREHRVCTSCCRCAVEDLHHIMFDCPAYAQIRARHTSLFQHATATVTAVFNTGQHGLLGRFLRKCHVHRLYRLNRPPISVSLCFKAWAQQSWVSHMPLVPLS